MNGTIKFVDGKTGTWGFIIPDDGSGDVYFRVSDFAGRKPTCDDDGASVEFEAQEAGEGQHRRAVRPRLLDLSPPVHGATTSPEHAGQMMQGTIKFVDSTSGMWGFIEPDDGSDGVYFRVSSFVGRKPTCDDDGASVEFETQEAGEGQHRRALRPRLLDPSPPVHGAATSPESAGQMMQGTIKFVDATSGMWGFIEPNDGSDGVYFRVSDFVGLKPTAADKDQPVAFEPQDRGEGQHRLALRPVLLEEPRPIDPSKLYGSGPGAALNRWAFVPSSPFACAARDREEYLSAYHLLASLALQERWHYGQEPDPDDPYPILRNYLRYTFYRLQKEGKVAEHRSSAGAWAAFNTGLVNRLYDPIYALFSENPSPSRPWAFYDFCVPAIGYSGRQLTAVFDPLPEQAKYFSSNFDMLLDTSKEIHIDYEHVILDGVRDDRYPPDFLARHVPAGFTWQEYWEMQPEAKSEYLRALSKAVEQDDQCYRAIRNRVEDAKELAEKRTRWNYKTAIPQYHPRFDSMSFLLPFAIVDDETVDLALVVTRNLSGSYQGRTVFPLNWAYSNARLVCRPHSDWLIPDQIRPEGLREEEEEEEKPEETSPVE